MVELLLGLHLSCYTGNSGKHSMILFKGRTQSGQKLAVSVCMAAGIKCPVLMLCVISAIQRMAGSGNGQIRSRPEPSLIHMGKDQAFPGKPLKR